MNEEIKTQILGLCKEVQSDPMIDGCRYTYLDDTFALVFTENEGVIYGKIAFNADDLQCDYDWDWTMPVDPETNEVIDTELGYPTEKFSELDPDTIAEEFLLDYYDMIKSLNRTKNNKTSPQKPETKKSEEILTEEDKQAQIDNLDISDLPDMPDAKPCTYQVWLLGFDEEDNAIDAEEMLAEFDDPDAAVQYAKSNATLNHELPHGAYSAEVRVEEVVSVDGGEMEIGTIYTDRI